MSLRMAIAVIFMCGVAGAAEFHVAADGSATGGGTADTPWDFQTAIGGAKPVKPGDNISLHAGTYRGGFFCKIKGDEAKPITIRPAPGERVIIDCRPRDVKDTGLFSVEGAHVIIRDLEFTCSDPQRVTTNSGSFPADIHRGGINVSGSGVKIINCIIHDCFNGIGSWSNGAGGEIYGCIIYNNGWKGPDRGHGHGIYTQNKDGTKRIADNIVFNQFSYGIHAYGSSRAFLRGFQIEGNVIFDNGAPVGHNNPAILVGGGSPAERISVASNVIYRGVVQLGYEPRVKNRDVSFIGNYIVGQTAIQSWEKLIDQDNTIVNPARVAQSEPRVFVRPNQYEHGRGNLVVFNPQALETVEVDLKDVLKPGQKFRIVSAGDFFGQAILSGTFEGKPLAFPMKAVAPPSPVGMENLRLAPTQPQFGAYIVLGG